MGSESKGAKNAIVSSDRRKDVDKGFFPRKPKLKLLSKLKSIQTVGQQTDNCLDGQYMVHYCFKPKYSAFTFCLTLINMHH